jgi:predicted dehydrogenase
MIRIGIAGGGFFGGVHAAAIATVPGLCVEAVCAQTPEAAAAFAALHGGRPVGSWQALVEDPAVDVVLIAMPHHLHAPVALAAAAAGKHILLEKPMAPTRAECDAITRAAAEAGVTLMIGQVMRFVLPCLAARKYIGSGALGRPRYGRSVFAKRWMEANRRDWHLSPATGGGMLLTAGIHALDRLVWLMGSRVASVSAMAGNLFHDQSVPDVDLALLRFDDGALGELASIGTSDATTLNTTEIICEHGTLAIDMETGVRIGRGNAWTPLANSSEPNWLPRGVAREWVALQAALTGHTQSPVGGADGAHLIACIEAAAASARAGREVGVV